MVTSAQSALSFILLIVFGEISANKSKISIERYFGKLRSIRAFIPQLGIQKISDAFSICG